MEPTTLVRMDWLERDKEAARETEAILWALTAGVRLVQSELVGGWAVTFNGMNYPQRFGLIDVD